MTYDIDPGTAEMIDRNFTYHPPQPDQVHRYGILRSNFRDLATEVARLCPPSRERSLALTKIEEAVMWANAAIARNETDDGTETKD